VKLTAATERCRIFGDCGGNDLAAQTMSQIKVAVKQAFNSIDEIIFEAALALYASETRYRQKEYAK